MQYLVSRRKGDILRSAKSHKGWKTIHNKLEFKNAMTLFYQLECSVHHQDSSLFFKIAILRVCIIYIYRVIHQKMHYLSLLLFLDGSTVTQNFSFTQNTSVIPSHIEKGSFINHVHSFLDICDLFPPLWTILLNKANNQQLTYTLNLFYKHPL